MSETTLHLLFNATVETVYMIFASGLISALIGLILGVILFTTRPNQILQNSLCHRGLGFVVNIVRSVPFIILLVAIIPLTRLIVGTSIGTNAAIVPLTLGAIPFVARIVENALSEVNPGLLEAGLAMGATSAQMIAKVLIPEACPGIIRGITVVLINLVGYSAMAGTVGGGGLGAVAINYGYQRFNPGIMLATVVILVVFVQGLQWLGDFLAQRFTH